jgi:sulfotransferase 6B1
MESAFKLQARLLRRTVRRSAQMLRHRRISLAGVPVLFANSFPKSGTHLLTQILQAFPQIGPAVDSGLPAVVTYAGDSGAEQPLANILGDLRRYKPGDIGYGHLHARPEVVHLLCEEGFAAYFILRDPRDVVVSHVYYVTEMAPGHVHHTYYTQELHTFEERLRTSILGLPDSSIPFPDIAARFEPYLGWLNRSEVLTLQFEVLVQRPTEAIREILQFAVQRGFPLSTSPESARDTLLQAINPARSPTFRSGKTGGWRDKFTPEMTSLFKTVAGDLLIRLGYESDHDW